MATYFYIQGNNLFFPESIDIPQNFPFWDRVDSVYKRVSGLAEGMGFGPEAVKKLKVEFREGIFSPSTRGTMEEPEIRLPIFWLFHLQDFQSATPEFFWLKEKYEVEKFTQEEKEVLAVFAEIERNSDLAEEARRFVECHELAHRVLKHKGYRQGEDDAASQRQEIDADRLAVSFLGSSEGAVHLFHAMIKWKKTKECTTHPSYEERIAAVTQALNCNFLEIFV